MPSPLDTSWYRQVLGQYPTGVCVVTATQADGSHAGFVVGSFTSVSLDPPLVAFFPDKKSSSWPKIEGAKHFCVNILSADQEHLCRQFSSKTGDKFAGVKTRPAATGAPIIQDVVAWIDCDIESVLDAGDHYIVVGRVRELSVENPSLPLLFFQGGYGRFAPLSLAAADERGRFAEGLREADLLRPVMEDLASDLGARVVATVVDDEDLLVLASAGSPNAGARATLVGLRIPFAPHNGSAFNAWLDQEGRDRVLSSVQEGPEREEIRRRINAVRDRGFSLGLINDAQRKFALALDQLAEDPSALNSDDLRSLVTQLEYEPAELTAPALDAVRVIAAPVRRASGEAALVLTVYGFSKPRRDDDVVVHIDRLLQSAERGARLLSTQPSPVN